LLIERRRMGIRIEKKIVCYESVTMSAIDPAFLGISEEKLREYLKTHPQPVDPLYPEDYMVNDICHSSGMLTLPDGISGETTEFLCQLIYDLM